jgi:hypothetical protein
MRTPFKYPCVYVWIILKRILKWDWSGGISLMNPSGHGPLAGCCEYPNEPFGFNKMRGMSWLAKKLLVPQERLHSMELFWWQFVVWDSAFKFCLSSVARQGVWRLELLLFKPWGTTLILCTAALPSSLSVSLRTARAEYSAVYRIRPDPFLLILDVARKSTLCCPLCRRNHTDLPMVYV